MKTKILTLLLVLLIGGTLHVHAQSVGIGDKEFTPQPGAILEIQSTNKGVLIPRVTYAQRMYIPINPQSEGLFVYQTDKEAGFYYYDGVEWKNLAPIINIDGGSIDALAPVAISGNYSDLKEKPVIPTKLQDLAQDDKYQTVSAKEKEDWARSSGFSGKYIDLEGKPDLKTVATSGSYEDLSNKPTYSKIATSGSYEDLIHAPIYSKVATTGSWTDLDNKPIIPTSLRDLVQDDWYAMYVSKAEKDKWNATAEASNFDGSYTSLKNKPDFKAVATSGSYEDLTNMPTYSKVATSGNYEDLQNKPVVPNSLRDLAQDDLYAMYVTKTEKDKWNATAQANSFTGKYIDLEGKPDLKPVATSGNYEDLQNKPVVPTSLRDLAQDDWYAMYVTKAEKDKWNATAQVNLFSGKWEDLENKPVIPSKLQDLAQDDLYAMYVTRSEKDKWNYTSENKPKWEEIENKPVVPTHLSQLSSDDFYSTIERKDREKWDAKSNFSGNYEDLQNKPRTVEKLSDLNNLTGNIEYNTVSFEQMSAWNRWNGYEPSSLASTSLVAEETNKVRETLGNLISNKADINHGHTMDVLPEVTLALNGKVDKVEGKSLTEANFSKEEKLKLANIEMYVHPLNHPASMIIQDASSRFVTDAEKNKWNSKANFDANAGGDLAGNYPNPIIKENVNLLGAPTTTTFPSSNFPSAGSYDSRIATTKTVSNILENIKEGAATVEAVNNGNFRVVLNEGIIIPGDDKKFPKTESPVPIGVSGGAPKDVDYISTTKYLHAELSKLRTELISQLKSDINNTFNAQFPAGTVIMANADLPMNNCWEKLTEMDGRFPVGAGSSNGIDIGQYTVGQTTDDNKVKGLKEVKLDVSQMPAHSHVIYYGGAQSGNGNGTRVIPNDNFRPSGDNSQTTAVTGGSLPHENRPPFYALNFYKKKEGCISLP